MRTNLVNINFHGNAFEGIKSNYKLAVKSVGEAMHAINVKTKNNLFKTLIDNDKKGIKYQVLINNKVFKSEKPIDPEDESSIRNSELGMNFDGLKSIDIVPVIEGGDANIGTIILGVVLIVLGIVLEFIPGFQVLGTALIIGGLALTAAGVINLLSAPPKFDDFREISGGGKNSYLFNGPENTENEGGPLPCGWGRLLVGSHVISASYEISEVSALDNPLTV